jgi:hypothetical protein
MCEPTVSIPHRPHEARIIGPTWEQARSMTLGPSLEPCDWPPHTDWKAGPPVGTHGQLLSAFLSMAKSFLPRGNGHVPRSTAATSPCVLLVRPHASLRAVEVVLRGGLSRRRTAGRALIRRIKVPTAPHLTLRFVFPLACVTFRLIIVANSDE